MSNVTEVVPGVWQLRLGTPEKITPVALREIAPVAGDLPAAKLPFDPAAVRYKSTARGCVVEIPMGDGEQIFGFGLQLKSLNQTAKKRTIRVNSDPLADTGDSHAPVPFYVSTAGYGVYVDTARYVQFNTGSHVKVGAGTPASGGAVPSGSVAELYKARELQGRFVIADVPVARGVDVYLFAGPDLRTAVQRYNLWSGGGCLPPLWGLGVWYRASTHHNADGALALAKQIRADGLPCDVFALEPGWQSQAYSCSFRWSPDRFPQPEQFLAGVRALGYRVNLWEHAFTHPTAAFYDALKPHSGDYEVWGGLIPDFSRPEARRIFGDYHGREFVDKGIDGFKLDECDNSDFTPWFWSFPEVVEFPSGMDGEQMHSLFGPLYLRTLYEQFTKRNRRTFSQVRAQHALAAPYPFVLYSDLYDHKDFIRGVVTAGFSGVLWSPEVREGKSIEDLLRRIQAVCLSPHALINAWYIKNPPWRQFDMDKNNRDEIMPEAEKVTSAVRKMFELRMRLLPYLYTAFARYRFTGLPVCRALVMDYPTDPQTHKLDDQWLLGDSLLVAPLVAGQTEREVYLPAGEWYNFWTGEKCRGAQAHPCRADLDTIPIFVKSGSVLPLAEPVQCVKPDTVFNITVHAYGAATTGALFEDDGETFATAHNWLHLDVRTKTVTHTGNFAGVKYRITGWKLAG